MKRLALILLLIASPALAAYYPSRVVGVSDGDTLTVLQDGKTQNRPVITASLAEG